MNKKWEYYETDEDLVKKISKKFDISEILAKVLINRDIKSEEEIKTFLEPTRNDFHDPFLMKDMR